MGNIPRAELVKKLKQRSILSPSETNELCDELIRITERSGTPGELRGDGRRFSDIIDLMFSDDFKDRLLASLMRIKTQ